MENRIATAPHVKQHKEGGEGAIQHHSGIGSIDTNGLKDWHDWEAIAQEKQRTGIFL